MKYNESSYIQTLADQILETDGNFITNTEDGFLGLLSVQDICNHLAEKILFLSAYPDFIVRVKDNLSLMKLQSFFASLFSLTNYKNPDLVIANILKTHNFKLCGDAYITMMIFFGPETNDFYTIKSLSKDNPNIFMTSLLTMIWCCSASKDSLYNRERSYDEATQLFRNGLDYNFPIGVLHGFAMHCSYGFSKEKHYIKHYINKYIEKSIPKYLTDEIQSLNVYNNYDPETIFVVADSIHHNHAVYRVLAKTLVSLSMRYKLICVVNTPYESVVDRSLFDKVLVLPSDDVITALTNLVSFTKQYRPVAIYYPAVGMSLWTIVYSTFRLAKLQFTSFGHSATTFSESMDCFLAEKDFAGIPSTYSEKVVLLPSGATPYIDMHGVNYNKRQKVKYYDVDIINVCYCGSFMKLNYSYLQIIKNLDSCFNRNKKRVSFHFILASLQKNLYGFSLMKQVQDISPNIVFNFSMPPAEYIEYLSDMDIVLNPFPYGNNNTLIDTLKVGAIPLCLEGGSIHEAIDSGIIRRAGLPEILIASTLLEYQITAERLIHDDSLRNSIQTNIAFSDCTKTFHSDPNSLFLEAIEELISPR